jgi:hypothetical protein
VELFISYAHADEDRVRRLVEILRAAGHKPWFDEWLLPGQDWQEALTDAIRDCDALLYALTRKSVRSEYCQWEFGTAVEMGRPIIPVLFEEKAALPGLLSRYQYADFTRDPETDSMGFALSVARLIGGLSKIGVRIAPEDMPPKKTVPAQTIASVAIQSCDYDPATRILEVRFPGGRAYQYDDVPASVYQGLTSAPAPGKYFNQSIKGQYRYRRIQ